MKKEPEAAWITVDRQHYTRLMARNLSVLRASLGLSQSDLAGMIGVTRQTLSAAESGARELSWGNFIALLYVFTQNARALGLLQTMGIYTQELSSLFHVTNLSRLTGPEKAERPQNKGGEAE